MGVQRRSRAVPSDPFPASCRKGCGADGGGGGEVLSAAMLRTRQSELHSLPV